MTTTAAPVRFTQRPDHALILGLSTARAITLGICIAAVATIVVTWGMTAGLIAAIGISPLAGSALLTVEGQALIEWAPIGLQYLLAGARGRLRYLAKPDRPQPVGLLPMPGTAANLTVFEDADGTAILHDRQADTWTAIATVTGDGFLYADAETQDAATVGFGRALAAIGSDGQIARIHVIHRTRPSQVIAPPIPYAVDAGRLEAVRAYREAFAEYRDCWRHDTLVALTLGGKTARAAIRRVGHGRTAAARTLKTHRVSLPSALRNADASVETWLTPAELATWITGSFDPASTTITEETPEPTEVTAGPMATDETWSTLRADSAWHQTLWISQWPRFDSHPGFLAPLLLPAGATVTLSLVYEPIPTQVATRQIGRDKTALASDAALRRRIGQLDTAEQSARRTDTLQREADLAAGHLDMRHTALIAVTAASPGDLTGAVTRIRHAAAAAGCETRILYGQQLAAFTAATLPAGLRL